MSGPKFLPLFILNNTQIQEKKTDVQRIYVQYYCQVIQDGIFLNLY